MFVFLWCLLAVLIFIVFNLIFIEDFFDSMFFCLCLSLPDGSFYEFFVNLVSMLGRGIKQLKIDHPLVDFHGRFFPGVRVVDALDADLRYSFGRAECEGVHLCPVILLGLFGFKVLWSKGYRKID